MNCPKCGSINVAKLKIIHQSQTVEIDEDSSGLGVGIGSGGVGVGVGGGHTSGTHQSLLAKRCSPPKYGSAIPGVVIFGIIVSLVFGAVGDDFAPRLAAGLAATVIICIGIYFMVDKPEIPRVKAAYKEWLKKWICLSCGKEFKEDTK